MAINTLYSITRASLSVAKIGMLLGSSVCFLVAPASADQLDSVFKVGQSKAAAAQKSQVKIDGIADQTDALLQNYKQVNKEIEGLRVPGFKLPLQGTCFSQLCGAVLPRISLSTRFSCKAALTCMGAPGASSLF